MLIDVTLLLLNSNFHRAAIRCSELFFQRLLKVLKQAYKTYLSFRILKLTPIDPPGTKTGEVLILVTR